jgi:ABC-type branched-subunit amino acid transport system substrate-binding protein
MPVWDEAQIVNMVGVCLDTTITTSKCSRYTFRPFDYAPAQAVAFAPYLVGKLGKKWHIAYADYAWGQSTRDAYADEIKKVGGQIVGTTGIPLGTADMTAFLSKINGDFDGLFGIFFGKDGITIGNQAFDLGLTKKYKWAGDGAIAESTNLPALGAKIEGFVGINRYIPVMDPPLNTPAHKKFFDEAVVRLKQIDPSGPLPDRYVQSNYEAMNALKIGMEKSGFRGRDDTPKLIEALEGLEMKEGTTSLRATRRSARKTIRRSSESSSSTSRMASTTSPMSSRRRRRYSRPPASSRPRRWRRAFHWMWLSRRMEPRTALPSLLRTEDLILRFGGLTALNRVNFEVGPARCARSSGRTARGRAVSSTVSRVCYARLRGVSCSTVMTSPDFRPTASPAREWRDHIKLPTSSPIRARSRTSESRRSRAGTAGTC